MEKDNSELAARIYAQQRNAAVTVEEAPISFSPFPSTDCTLYSHFSFDDFVMIAFPDLTRDLDDQI